MNHRFLRELLAKEPPPGVLRGEKLTRRPIMKKVFIIAMALILGICITAASAVEVTRFGPKQYNRTTGKPNTYTDTFSASGSIGGGKLIVENGAANEDNRVSSAVISLNGKEVFGPSAFNQNVGHLEAPLNLLDTNTLAVELRSKPGSYLTIRVTQGIPLAVTITSPSNGATVSKPAITVQGQIVNPLGNETGVTVNGVIASVYGNQFVASHVPLQQGANTIQATATDTAGNSVSTSITINATIPANYVKLTADTEMGVSPLETTLRIGGSFSFAQAPVLTYAGPGEAQLIENPSPNEYRMRMTTAGIYTFMAEAKDPQGNTYTDTVSVTVLTKAELDTLLKAKWEGMRGRLLNSDIEGAVTFFNETSKQGYRDLFTVLVSMLPTIAQDMGDVQFIECMGDTAIYDMQTVRNGTKYSFQLLFTKDPYGIWRINSF
jgi:hypothetical protein